MPNSNPTTQTPQESLLITGAYIPITQLTPTKNITTDTIDARTYQHPALPNTSIVRLTPTPLTTAEDANMEFFGFSHTATTPKIAHRKREALGFPQWVLIHDPKNTARAIKIAQELRKNTKIAKTKPNAARKTFDTLAADITKTLPQLLPSFYEQIARIFIDAGNTDYAASAFTKAREAEATYALKIDEDQLHNAFLEFILAGAVTHKTMADYAQALNKRLGPEQTYERFFDLCVRRTLTGSLPDEAMIKVLQKLAKTLKLDAEAEDAHLIEQIWQSPSLSRTPSEFWKSYSKAFATLAKKNPAVRGFLLNLFPTPSPSDENFKSIWLQLLYDCDALAALAAPPEKQTLETAPEISTAAWFTKFCDQSFSTEYRQPEYGQPEECFRLLRDIAPRIKSDGEAIVFGAPKNAQYRTPTDIDLADLALELGLSVTINATLDFHAWAERENPTDEYQRPLQFITADKTLAERLTTDIHEAFGNTKFQELASTRPALDAARIAWLKQCADQAQNHALPGLYNALKTLTTNTSNSVFRDFPDSFKELKQISPTPAITRTIQNGLLDEYHWPAFEKTVEHFKKQHGTNPEDIKLIAQFPYLIMHDGRHAIVLNHDGIQLEHDLQLPDDFKAILWIFYAQKQLGVAYAFGRIDHESYWSDNPSQKYPQKYATIGESGITIELENGAILYGQYLASPGSFAPERVKGSPVSDQKNFWIWRPWNSDDEHSYVDFDPKTNEPGSMSMPQFFEDYRHPDYELQFINLSMYPIGSPDIQSPLGSKNGLYGWRIRKNIANPNHIQAEAIDGRSLEITNGSFEPTALLSIPAANAPRPFHKTKEGWHLYTPDASTQTLTHSDSFSPTQHLPQAFWHYLTPRDPAGSARLRTITEIDVQNLVDASLKSTEDCKNAIKQCLPEITDPTLIDALVKAIEASRYKLADFQAFLAANAPAAHDAADAEGLLPLLDDKAIAALAPVFQIRHWYSKYNYSNSENDPPRIDHKLTQIADFLFNNGESLDTDIFHFPWNQLIGNESIALHMALSQHTDKTDRDTIINILKGWSHLGFFRYDGKMRTITATMAPAQSTSFIAQPRTDAIISAVFENNRYVCMFNRQYAEKQFEILEYAPTGNFKTPPGITILEEFIHPTPTFDPQEIIDLLEKATTNGPILFDKKRVQNLAEQTGLSYLEACILWPGYPYAWTEESLSAELRKNMALKVSEVELGRKTMYELPRHKKHEVLLNFPPTPQLDPWQENNTADPYVDQLAKSWTQTFGKPTVVLDSVDITPDTSELVLKFDASETIDAMREPDTTPKTALSVQTLLRPLSAAHAAFDLRNRPLDANFDNITPRNLFDHRVLLDALLVTSHIFTNHPVGDTLRQQIPPFLKAILTRLNDPELLFTIHTESLNFAHDSERQTHLWLNKIDGTVTTEEFHKIADAGLIVGHFTLKKLAISFRPSQLIAGKTHPVFTDFQKDTHATNTPSEQSITTLYATQTLAGPDFQAFITRTESTPVPHGQYETNPLYATPELITEITQTLQISENAAILFLQTLTLHHPTTKNIRLWNTWTAATYNNAAKELTTLNLLIEAKRARAGRKHFIDGLWIEQKKPHLPLEAWKLPLYQNPQSQSFPLANIIALKPPHLLFHQAWTRYKSGDKPTF